MQVKLLIGKLTSAFIQFSGIPQSPNPPSIIVELLGISLQACWAFKTCLLIIVYQLSSLDQLSSRPLFTGLLIL